MSGKNNITVGIDKPDTGSNNEIDAVLKTGDIILDDLNLSIENAVFAWRLNKVEFNPGAYTTILTPTTDEYIRYDLLVGTSQGNYAIKKGIEGEFSANIPTADKGSIALAVLSLKGNKILQTIPEPVIDLSSIENRITVLENFNPVPETGLTGQAYAVWSGIGLKYYGSYPNYYIQSVLKQKGSGEVTLDATTSMTAGQKRYDLIIVDANGLNKITGVADENPILPTINPDTQIIISNVLLNAGDIIPSDNTVVREQIYDDNVEWVVSKKDNGVAINPNYTTQKFKGLKSLQITNFGSNREHIVFDKTNPNSFTKTFLDFDALTFRIYLPSNLNSNMAFDIWFEKQSGSIGQVGRVTSIFDFKTGKFGYNESLKNTWQLIIIPLSVFEISEITFNSLWIRREAGDRHCLLDDIALVGANAIANPTKQKAITSIVTDNGVASATKEDDTFSMKGLEAVEVKASGKDITIDVKNATDTLSGVVKIDTPTADPVVYTRETSDNLLKAKVNAILEIKPIAGIAYDLTAYDTTNLVELIYEDTLPMTVTIPNDATLNLPVGSIFYTVATNTGALSIAGGAGVTFQTAVGLTAGQNEVRKYVKKAANVWGIEGGAGVVVNTPKTPFTVFIDTVNGNNATAKIEDASKPFKTDTAAFAALPTDNLNVWTFYFIDNNVTRTLSQFPGTRKIMYVCYNTGTFDISAWTSLITIGYLYFEIPYATLLHNSGTSTRITSSVPCYINANSINIQTIAHPSGSTFFQLNGLIRANSVTQRNTSGKAFSDCELLVGIFDTTNTILFSSNGSLNSKINNLILGGQNCTYGFTDGNLLIGKISGTGTFTIGLKNIDITGLDCPAAINVSLANGSCLKGVMSPNFLGGLVFLQGASLSIISNYKGRLNNFNYGSGWTVNVAIYNSYIITPGVFFVASASTSSTLFLVVNSVIEQTTPAALFTNVNASTPLTIKKVGTFYSNATSLGSNVSIVASSLTSY